MNETARLHWIAQHILPLEPEVRGWLRTHATSLNPADVDDLIQEGYARLWSATLPSITQPRAYFYAVLRNLLAERARRARVVPMERMGEIEALRIHSEEPGPERCVGARQELAQLLQALAQLPQRCREAFELCKFENLPQRAIAERMGITEKTVEKHLAKALLLLTQALGQGVADQTPARQRPQDKREQRD